MELTIEEQECIDRNLDFYRALDQGTKTPETELQKRFVNVCQGYEKPESAHEKAYFKHQVITYWFSTLKVIDLHSSKVPEGHRPVCDLCGKAGLRWHCELMHIKTRFHMYVGSECIFKFRVLGMDRQGNRIGVKETVDCINARIGDLKKESVIQLLRELWKKEHDSREKVAEAADFYQKNDKFKPTHLALVLSSLETHNIPFNCKFFKTGFGMEFREEMVKMPPEDFERIKPYLKKDQLERMTGMRNFGMAF